MKIVSNAMISGANTYKELLFTRTVFLPFLIGLLFSSCNKTEDEAMAKRVYTTSFEMADDFAGFYLTPQNYLNTSFHELNDSIVRSGNFSHKAWIHGANQPSTYSQNNNHRAYPTIQLYKTAKGSFNTPCYITFWVWLDMDLHANAVGENDWFSLATFTDDETDNWNRTVLVNLSYDGCVHLMHVPDQGQQEHIFQTSADKFPQKEWVEIKLFLDFSSNGYSKVWQNGTMVSHANIRGLSNRLSQAHFGLYCSPQINSGLVYNDDLRIEEVDKE